MASPTATAPPPAPQAKRQRHLNFTRRVAVPPREVSLTLARPDAGCTEVDLLWPADGDSSAGPAKFGEAEVFLEASRQTFWQRHSAGRACALADAGGAARLDFDEFETLEGVRFRLKVTGRGRHDRGRLLASASKLRVAGLPADIEGRSLLPVLGADLGPRPYRLDFDDGGPLLVLNTRLGFKEAVAADPAVVALVLPAAVGRIAERLLAETGDLSEADLRAAGGWQADWFGFLRDRLRIRRPAADAGDVEELDADPEQWVEQVVEAFCSEHGLTGRLLASPHWSALGDDDD